MIKNGILNFLKNLKHIFTPLGTLFLGVMFGICFLVSGFKTQVNLATTQIRQITAEADISYESLKKCVIDSFSEISFEDPIEAIKTLTSQEWLNGTLKANLENQFQNYADFAIDIERAVISAINGYSVYIVMFVICSVLGLVGGYFLTRFLIRRSIAKRSFLKYILVSVLDGFLTAGVAGLMVYLTMLWTPSIFITSIFSIILCGVVSLFEAYVIHAYKAVPIKNIVNIKNIFALFASNLLIYLIALIISMIMFAITNAVVGWFITLSLLIVAFIVVSLNAEAYVKKVANKEEQLSPSSVAKEEQVKNN